MHTRCEEKFKLQFVGKLNRSKWDMTLVCVCGIGNVGTERQAGARGAGSSGGRSGRWATAHQACQSAWREDASADQTDQVMISCTSRPRRREVTMSSRRRAQLGLDVVSRSLLWQLVLLQPPCTSSLLYYKHVCTSLGWHSLDVFDVSNVRYDWLLGSCYCV